MRKGFIAIAVILIAVVNASAQTSIDEFYKSLGLNKIERNQDITKRADSNELLSGLSKKQRSDSNLSKAVIYDFSNGDVGVFVPLKRNSRTNQSGYFFKHLRNSNKNSQVYTLLSTTENGSTIIRVDDTRVIFRPKGGGVKTPQNTTTGPRLPGESFKACFKRNWDHFQDDGSIESFIAQEFFPELVAAACALACAI